MRNNRLQNHISESSFTLPLCIVLGLFAWFWNAGVGSFDYSLSSFMTLVVASLTTFLVTEIANKYSLLRVRSNMISAVWVLALMLTPFTHTYSAGWVATLAIVGSYYILFMAYQLRQPVEHVFHTFVLLGIAVIAIPQLLILVPMYYWYLLVFLRSLTWRSFWAGIVGLFLPMLFVLGWSILVKDYSFLSGKWTSLMCTELFGSQNYLWMMSFSNSEALIFIFLTLLTLISIVHYLTNYYDDKISTRMYLYIYTMQSVVIWAMIMCMPNMYTLLAPVFLLNSCVMIAHFFALTGSWISNAFFCLTMIATVLLTLINFGIWKL